MSCTSPLTAYRKLGGGVTFDRRESNGVELTLPCRRCIGCRLKHGRAWAVRIMHEASYYDDNVFVTLTYNDFNLPRDGGLCVSDFQKFMKRLRKGLGKKKIRFFHAGEYGEKTNRPHYHAILFNHRFDDIEETEGSTPTRKIFTSEELQKLWGMGHVSVSDILPEHADYIGKYTLKKVGGERSEEHYLRVCPETGECHKVAPEYATMSLRPGIGRRYFEDFSDEIYTELYDEVIFKGKPYQPPKYYDTLLKQRDPELYEKTLKNREKAFAEYRERIPDQEAWREARAIINASVLDASQRNKGL